MPNQNFTLPACFVYLSLLHIYYRTFTLLICHCQDTFPDKDKQVAQVPNPDTWNNQTSLASTSEIIDVYDNTCSSKIFHYIVPVLWREEGYTVKYSLTPREIPMAEPKGFPEGSGYISPYIPTWVMIQTFSISKSYTSSIVLPGRAILEELILRIGLAAGAIFSRIAQ